MGSNFDFMQFSFLENIRLENNRSLLRPLQLEDAEGLQQAANSDPDLLKYSIGRIETPELLKEYIQTGIEERTNGIRYPFLIIDKASGQFAGCTSFSTISPEDERLEIG